MTEPLTTLLLGGLVGYALKPDGRLEPIDYSKLAAMLDGSDKAFAKNVHIDTSTARETPEKFSIPGMMIFIDNPATPTQPVYIRFNDPSGEEFTLTEFKKIRGPFGSFYIRNEAGAGTLNLIVTKGFQFEFSEAIGNVSTVVDHGAATGLTDDDHTQYLLADGTRQLTGDMSVAGGKTIDGVDISDHKDRHDPEDGTDPLDCAAPGTNITPEQTNAEGSAHSFARSDHMHNIPSGAPGTNITPEQANAEGAAAAFARTDHMHYLPSGTPGTIQPDDSAAEGTGAAFARTDHAHAIVAAAPTGAVAESASSTEGTGTSFVREDHVHEAPTTWAPSAHGAAQHTDVTREHFMPYSEGHVIAGTPGEGGCHGGANAEEPIVEFFMKVPDDFVSFTSVKAIWWCGAEAGNMYWHITAPGYSACGETVDTHSDEPAIGVTATGGADIRNCQEPANALTLASLALGDVINLIFIRNGTHGNDTLDDDVYLEGLLFTYVGHQ